MSHQFEYDNNSHRFSKEQLKVVKQLFEFLFGHQNLNNYIQILQFYFKELKKILINNYELQVIYCYQIFTKAIRLYEFSDKLILFYPQIKNKYQKLLMKQKNDEQLQNDIIREYIESLQNETKYTLIDQDNEQQNSTSNQNDQQTSQHSDEQDVLLDNKSYENETCILSQEIRQQIELKIQQLEQLNEDQKQELILLLKQQYTEKQKLHIYFQVPTDQIDYLLQKINKELNYYGKNARKQIIDLLCDEQECGSNFEELNLPFIQYLKQTQIQIINIPEEQITHAFVFTNHLLDQVQEIQCKNEQVQEELNNIFSKLLNELDIKAKKKQFVLKMIQFVYQVCNEKYYSCIDVLLKNITSNVKNQQYDQYSKYEVDQLQDNYIIINLQKEINYEFDLKIKYPIKFLNDLADYFIDIIDQCNTSIDQQLQEFQLDFQQLLNTDNVYQYLTTNQSSIQKFYNTHRKASKDLRFIIDYYEFPILVQFTSVIQQVIGFKPKYLLSFLWSFAEYQKDALDKKNNDNLFILDEQMIIDDETQNLLTNQEININYNNTDEIVMVNE